MKAFAVYTGGSIFSVWDDQGMPQNVTYICFDECPFLSDLNLVHRPHRTMNQDNAKTWPVTSATVVCNNGDKFAALLNVSAIFYFKVVKLVCKICTYILLYIFSLTLFRL